MYLYYIIKEALLIHRHKPTLNIQKEAYETLHFTQLGREYKVKLPRSFLKLAKTPGNLIEVVGLRVSAITIYTF